MKFSRLLTKAHLLRCPLQALLQRTSKVRLSRAFAGALHLGPFSTAWAKTVCQQTVSSLLLFLFLIIISPIAESGDLKIEKRIAGENLAFVLSEGDKIYELYTIIPDSMRDPFARGLPLFLGVIEKHGDKQRVIYFHDSQESFPSDLTISNGKIYILLQNIDGKTGTILELNPSREIYSGLIEKNLWDILNNKMYYVSNDELFEVVDGNRKKLADLRMGERAEQISANEDGVYIACGDGLFLYDFSQTRLIKITDGLPRWFEAGKNSGVLYLEANVIQRWSGEEGSKIHYKSDSEIWFVKKNPDSILIIDDKITVISNMEIDSVAPEEKDGFANLRDAVFSGGSVIIYYNDTISRVVRGIKRRIRLYPRASDRDLLVRLFKDQKIGADVILSIVREDLNSGFNHEDDIRNKIYALSLLELLGSDGFDEGRRIYLRYYDSISEDIRKLFVEKLRKIDPEKTDNDLLIKKY